MKVANNVDALVVVTASQKLVSVLRTASNVRLRDLGFRASVELGVKILMGGRFLTKWRFRYILSIP